MNKFKSDAMNSCCHLPRMLDFPPNGRPGTSILPRLASHHIDGVSCHAQNTHILPWHPFHPIQSYHHPADIQKRTPTTTHTRPGTKKSTHNYRQSLVCRHQQLHTQALASQNHSQHCFQIWCSMLSLHCFFELGIALLPGVERGET